MRFGESRQIAVREATRLGLLNPNRSDRWSEKMLTLTAPHVGATSRRISVIFEAWRLFSRWLQRGWRALEKALLLRPFYYRAFEWTAGHDLRGHPHFHIWLLSPFIDVDDAREAWRDALMAVGVEFEDGQVPIVHIKEIVVRREEFSHELLKGDDAIKFSRVVTGTGGEDVASYITGWCIVDQSQTERVPVETLAEVYKALENRRLTQGSRGFLSPYTPSCRSCGTVHPRVRVARVLSPTTTSVERPENERGHHDG